MKLPIPSLYSLQLGPHASYEVVLDGTAQPKFSKPETLVCPKLYVVMRQKEIHYVGVTNRPMAARINIGLKAAGKTGYHGYKWKTFRDPLRLQIWSFPDQSGRAFLRELETVEAEFAFHVRKEAGAWPRSQTEIHFYQATPAHLAAVSEMFKKCSP